MKPAPVQIFARSARLYRLCADQRRPRYRRQGRRNRLQPDPAVISEGFDIAEIQKYVSGEKKYRILAFSELTRFTVSVGDKSYDALNGTTEGISLEQGRQIQRPADALRCVLRFVPGRRPESDAPHRGRQRRFLGGRYDLPPGGAGSRNGGRRYDLWANTVTLRVVSCPHAGTTVQFGLRSSGGSGSRWQGRRRATISSRRPMRPSGFRKP